jgi:hypothetical protein
MQHEVVCFAHGRPGDWEGICLDFDIAVQGESFDEVRRALQAAVSDYVSAAMDEEPETREKLLKRSTPLWQYLVA